MYKILTIGTDDRNDQLAFCGLKLKNSDYLLHKTNINRHGQILIGIY